MHSRTPQKCPVTMIATLGMEPQVVTIPLNALLDPSGKGCVGHIPLGSTCQSISKTGRITCRRSPIM